MAQEGMRFFDCGFCSEKTASVSALLESYRQHCRLELHLCHIPPCSTKRQQQCIR